MSRPSRRIVVIAAQGQLIDPVTFKTTEESTALLDILEVLRGTLLVHLVSLAVRLRTLVICSMYMLSLRSINIPILTLRVLERSQGQQWARHVQCPIARAGSVAWSAVPSYSVTGVPGGLN